MGKALFFNIIASFFNVLLVVVIKLMVNKEMITPEIASFFRHISALIIILPFILLTLKKEPKHFYALARVPGDLTWAQENKVFLLLFLQKKKTFPKVSLNNYLIIVMALG